MPTPVLRYGHQNHPTNMATAEYHRGHGTLVLGKLFGPGSPLSTLVKFAQNARLLALD